MNIKIIANVDVSGYMERDCLCKKSSKEIRNNCIDLVLDAVDEYDVYDCTVLSVQKSLDDAYVYNVSLTIECDSEEDIPIIEYDEETCCFVFKDTLYLDKCRFNDCIEYNEDAYKDYDSENDEDEY